MKITIKQYVAVALYAVTLSAGAGIQLGATRVIYDGAAPAASLRIHNDRPAPYLVQTWLDKGDSSAVPENFPLRVTPALLKLGGMKEGVLHFIYSGQGLPQDRESLFWINVQEIPPMPQDKEAVQIAVRTRVKLFYRPSGLNTTLPEQVAGLKWHHQGHQLVIENNGPFNITLSALKVKNSAGHEISLEVDMIRACDRAIVALPAAASSYRQLAFSYINDYGGNTEVKDISL